MILLCGTWYGCVGVWVCVLGLDEQCDRFKKQVQTFSTEFFDCWKIQSKKSSLTTRSASRNSQSKKVESKKPFSDCVRKPDLGFSRKRPFSTDKSDCIRNDLRPFLMQSDSASRKRPFSTGLFSTGFFWSFFLSSVESIYSFCALPRGGWCQGVLLYSSSRNRLAALCFALSP